MQELELWLATPDAGRHFDPATLSAADRLRWQEIQSPRRLADWNSSRALLAHRPPPAHGVSSLSHSAGYAALALGAAGLLLGVDLERVRPRRILDLAASWFTPREFEQLSELPAAEQQAHFYLLWTLKEACTKALGLGLLQALRDCAWWFDADGWHAELPIQQPWHAWVFAPQSDLRLALFVAAPPGAPELAKWGTRFPATHGWPGARSGEWPCLLDLSQAS